MPNLPKPRALRRLSIPVLLLTAAMPALAQLPAATTTQSLSSSTDPAELLAQALRTLATEPSNLSALTAAGHNAVILGDPNAAVGFFGRAQEIAPNDGRVKAGLGSALVQLERPQDALRLFAQASRLGVPDAEFAEDRGLAYDLTGDQARAQADYRTVLAAHPEDDNARRRLALSQGISGQKAAAIATLDPLIRKRDIAGWRAQTFVLAMDGDAKGANDITRVMLPQQAAMLQPFLVRLATLSPADKARAVHFGEMPATGATYTPTQVASVSAPATYASAPPRATAPASDLAPPAKKPEPLPAATSPATATQVAAATPKPGETRRPANVSINDRDQIFALGQPRYVAAPLAGIALTPAKPMPQPAPTPAQTTVAATPPPASALATAPSVQVVQAEPHHAEIAGPPAPPLSDLPTPAAEGHYDLPHDAATKAAARPARPAPMAAKTIGTPVVHDKTGTPTTAPDADAMATPAAVKKPGKAQAKTELAAADDGDAQSSKARTGKASAKDDDADTSSAKGTRSKSGDGASSKARSADADGDDCTPAPKTKGHSRAATKKKPATACSRLASADDDDTGVKTRKGAKAKASVVANSDDSKAKSSKAKADKGAAERVYVQVAGGANKDDMDKAWAGVKKKAPELMKGRTPSTTPLKATNRLLVGPFKDEDEAQAFVNKMATKGLSGFTFKSTNGQKVEKVDSGK